MNGTESDQGKRQEDAEEQQRAVLEAFSGCNLDTVDNPAGGQVKNGCDQGEVDELHECAGVLLSAHFPDAAVIGDQQDVRTTMRE